MVIQCQGKCLATTEDGFLLDSGEWNEAVAMEIAQACSIILDERHWEIVRFMRNYYLEFHHLPNARVFTKAVRSRLGAEKGNSHYLHALFPDGPLKYACRIAGLPKPPTCL